MKRKRSKGNIPQFLQLEYGMLQHPNFRALNGSAIKVLLGLCTKHTGFNNGKVHYSTEMASKDLGLGKATILRSFRELQYYGFIKLVKPGEFYGRKAHQWAITFVKSDGYPRTDEWKEARPKLKKRQGKKKTLTEQYIDDLIK